MLNEHLPDALVCPGVSFGDPRTPLTRTISLRDRILSRKSASSIPAPAIQLVHSSRLSLRDCILSNRNNSHQNSHSSSSSSLDPALPSLPHSISSQPPASLPCLPVTRGIRKGSEIAPSSFRPHVRACDRLHAWATPYSTSTRALQSSIYPHKVIEMGEKAMISGLALTSRSTYGAGLLRWVQFCDEFKIPEHLRMPASDQLVIGFIGFWMGRVSGGTIKTWLSGIRGWHDFHEAAWPFDSRRIRFARQGAYTAGSHHRRARRNPISIQHMLALYSGLDHSIPYHCAIWAVACIAFWGCRRLGELTIPSQNGFNPKLHVARNTPITRSTYADGSPRAISFNIPWTKTTKELGATVVGTVQRGPLAILCPFNALSKHIEANQGLPTDFSFFGYIDEKGSPHHMVKSSFLSFCSSIWTGKGFERVQGHSFRIGGAVELLIAGISPEVVASIGGWTSLAFLVYWRRFEDIIPTHVSKAYSETHIDRLKHIMDEFRKSNKIPDNLVNHCASGYDVIDFE
ncbi:hypothetical protein EV361DRAFT_811448 [Lentinula raphanica]|nr:hypothetical protein EV361DRAFT_811448 [Lentinula raphanica]